MVGPGFSKGPLRGDQSPLSYNTAASYQNICRDFDLSAYHSGKCVLTYLSAMTLTAVPNTSTLFPASATSGLENCFSRSFVVKGYKEIDQ